MHFTVYFYKETYLFHKISHYIQIHSLGHIYQLFCYKAPHSNNVHYRYVYILERKFPWDILKKCLPFHIYLIEFKKVKQKTPKRLKRSSDILQCVHHRILLESFSGHIFRWNLTIVEKSY